MKLTTEQSQMILRERGIELPTRIYGRDQIDPYLKDLPLMTPLDVTLYLRRALEIAGQ